MLTTYLKKAPTLIVIGVTGFAAWSTYSTEGDAAPAKSEAKPPAKAKAPASVETASMRDPFQVEQPEPPEALASGKDGPASAPKGKAADAPAKNPADDDRALLEGMKLGGTFIGGRDQFAVIDDRVYARGDRLRGEGGEPLPYVVSEIRKDRVSIRRDRRRFELAFSNVPRVIVPGAPAGTGATAIAKAPAAAGAQAVAKVDPPPSKKGPAVAARGGAEPGQVRGAMLQLFSSLMGSPSESLEAADKLTPLGRMLTSQPGVEVNQNTIAAGLDALMGKYDNIGREGTTP